MFDTVKTHTFDLFAWKRRNDIDLFHFYFQYVKLFYPRVENDFSALYPKHIQIVKVAC